MKASQKGRVMSWIQLGFGTAAVILLVIAAQDVFGDGVSRTADGKPDFTGHYDIATLTPLQRPAAFGDELFLTPEQAQAMERRAAVAKAEGSKNQDPDREAPPEGGDGSPGAAGNVGGYDTFWIDNGETASLVDGKFRTSIITNPVNGRRPEVTPERARWFMARRARFRENKGEAWWVHEGDGSGPYDNPEDRPLAERCLLGFGSTSGPPMLPVLYNNHKRIVQTEGRVMILNEMVHDVRVVRMNEEHLPEDMRRWLGDSIGWWEGDTLVVDTTNFTDQPALAGATRDLHVVEKFAMMEDGDVLYSFTVDDPNTWVAPWGGEYPWPRSNEPVYEYACHEGNYSFGNILRGARRLEQDAISAGGEE